MPCLSRTAIEPRARHEVPEVTLSFSDLKYFFECPYEFKLRFLYGFNPPIHEALGLRQVRARRDGRDPQAGHRRRHRLRP